MKKLIIIIAAALLAVGGTVGTVVGVNNSPKVVAMNAVANALEDLTKRDEVAPIFNAMNGGSLAFSAKGTDIEELMDLDEGAELSGKLYMNADKKALMLDNLSIEMGDFSLTGQFYAGSDAVYISNKEILDGTLGVERGSLVKDLKRSVLAPTSDSAYAMDEESYKILKEVFDALDNEVDQDLEKDLKKVTERYVKQAWKLVGEYAEFEAENDDVRINGDRQKARIITVTLDDKAACMIVEEMIEYLLDDDALADLVKEYGDRLENILKSTMGIEDPSKKYDDLMDELDDNMDEIIDSVKEGMQDDLVITIVTPPATADLLMLTVEYGQTEIFQAEFGHEGVRKTDCITVNVADVEVVYQVTENSRKSFEAKLAVNDSDLAKIEIDRSRDDFELELVDLCILEGDWSSKGKTTSITVDTVKVGEERYNHLKLELVLSESDKMPAREKNVDSILTVDEKDIEKWVKKAKEVFGIPQLSGTYSTEGAFGVYHKYTFSGNRYKETTKVLGASETIEGTYYITNNNGNMKITFEYENEDGFLITNAYSFEKGSEYIMINSIKYTME